MTATDHSTYLKLNVVPVSTQFSSRNRLSTRLSFSATGPLRSQARSRPRTPTFGNKRWHAYPGLAPHITREVGRGKLGEGSTFVTVEFQHALCTIDIKCIGITELLIKGAISLEIVEFGVQKLAFRCFHCILAADLVTPRCISAAIDELLV